MKLAVFDCDGTLVDSQANILRAMATTFAQAGLAAPPDHAVRRIVGLSLQQAMAALVPQAAPALHLQLAEDYKHIFQQMRADRTLDPEPLFTGIAALLNALQADGWALAVATGKSDRGLAITLDHHGIGHHFISLQTADRHPSKPHPAMLLACLDDTGVEAENAVIIGDTVFDIGMGTAAGITAIGVEWGYHDGAELLAAGAAGVAATAHELKELLDGRR